MKYNNFYNFKTLNIILQKRKDTKYTTFKKDKFLISAPKN
jgi:hypothetical protein